MLTIHPYDEAGNYTEGPWASLPFQLQNYLSKLDLYPLLQRLSYLDPYGDNRFSTEESVEMFNEVKLFQGEVMARSVGKPPLLVGNSPGEPPDEPYDWEGMENFCCSLMETLQKGIENNSGIISLGD